jgi:hypothetical protein
MIRYAVYYAPEPAHPLWAAGCRWLGRDPSRPDFRAPPHAATDEPRRYGFHATLKPPMALRDGTTPAAFLAAVDALAARTPRFEMPALAVGTLGRFVALRPVGPIDATHPLRRLADACVRELDAWRASPDERELQRRLDDPSLLREQKELLRRWGYPHVFEHWRFHMTLSDTIPEASRREGLRADAQRHFDAALAQPLVCASLCVYTEPAEGEPFVLSHRAALAR